MTRGGLRPRARALRVLPLLFLAPAASSCARRLPPPLAPSGAERGALLSLELAEARGGPADGPAIIDGLRSPFRTVRARAARAAGRWGPGRWGDRLEGEVVPVLIELARSDPDLVAVSESVFALGQLGVPTASAALAAAALDPSAELRALALEALSRIPGTTPGLLAASLHDPAPVARGGAVLALARLSSRIGPEGATGNGRREDAGGGVTPQDPLGDLVPERLDAEIDERVRWKLHYLVSRRPDLAARKEVRLRLAAALSSPNFLAGAFAAEALEKAAENPAGPVVGDGLGVIEALREAAGGRDRFWIARAAASRALRALASPAGPASPAGDEAGDERRGALPGFPHLLVIHPPPGTADRRAPPPAPFYSPALAGLRRDPRASFMLRGGQRVRIQLFRGEAPQSAAAFAWLARAGFYDGMVFRPSTAGRISPQLSSRLETGSSLRPETGPGPFLRGSVGAIDLRSASGEGAFFIALCPVPELDGRATLLGAVVEGMEVVDRLGEDSMTAPASGSPASGSPAVESTAIEGWPLPAAGSP